VAENLVHESLVSRSGVFEAKGHDLVEVIGIVRDEGGFMHV